MITSCTSNNPRYKDFGDDEVIIPAPPSSEWEFKEFVGAASGWKKSVSPQKSVKPFFVHRETGESTAAGAPRPNRPSKSTGFEHKKTGRRLWARKDTNGEVRWRTAGVKRYQSSAPSHGHTSKCTWSNNSHFCHAENNEGRFEFWLTCSRTACLNSARLVGVYFFT